MANFIGWLCACSMIYAIADGNWAAAERDDFGRGGAYIEGSTFTVSRHATEEKAEQDRRCAKARAIFSVQIAAEG